MGSALRSRSDWTTIPPNVTDIRQIWHAELVAAMAPRTNSCVRYRRLSVAAKRSADRKTARYHFSSRTTLDWNRCGVWFGEEVAMRMARQVCGLAVWAMWMSIGTNVARSDDAKPETVPPKARLLQTTDGIAFALLGDKPATPAPTVFVLAQEMKATLDDGYYNRIGRLLATKGFLCVSLDLPCHGADVREGEQAGGLTGWATRAKQDGNFVEPFTRRVSRVVDHLIAENFTDPQRIAVAGTSRGGFMALHTAAADERFRAAIAFAPVTHLPVLREFAGLEQDEATRSLSIIHLADKLAGRAIWTAIGNQDARVGTDECIAAIRSVVLASARKQPDPNFVIPVELRVFPIAGHGMYPTAHDDAAEWLLKQFPKQP